MIYIKESQTKQKIKKFLENDEDAMVATVLHGLKHSNVLNHLKVFYISQIDEMFLSKSDAFFKGTRSQIKSEDVYFYTNKNGDVCGYTKNEYINLCKSEIESIVEYVYAAPIVELITGVSGLVDILS